MEKYLFKDINFLDEFKNFEMTKLRRHLRFINKRKRKKKNPYFFGRAIYIYIYI